MPDDRPRIDPDPYYDPDYGGVDVKYPVDPVKARGRDRELVPGPFEGGGFGRRAIEGGLAHDRNMVLNPGQRDPGQRNPEQHERRRHAEVKGNAEVKKASYLMRLLAMGGSGLGLQEQRVLGFVVY